MKRILLALGIISMVSFSFAAEEVVVKPVDVTTTIEATTTATVTKAETVTKAAVQKAVDVVTTATK